MKLYELIKRTRSTRSFKSGVKIGEEELLSFIECARISSATMNLQPLKYRIVTDDGEVRALTEHTRWASSLSISLPPKGMGPAAFIVICHDTSITPDNPIFLKDVGITSEIIMLAAAEAGYASCILGSFDAQVPSLLSLDSHLVPKSVIALGASAEEIVLTESKQGEVTYYRDENNIHYVPKRALCDIIIKK